MGVVGLVLAGMAAGRYVAVLARLTSKFCVKYNTTSSSSSDVISAASAASRLTAPQPRPPCRLC